MARHDGMTIEAVYAIEAAREEMSEGLIAPLLWRGGQDGNCGRWPDREPDIDGCADIA
jgi:hypothetical protein